MKTKKCTVLKVVRNISEQSVDNVSIKQMVA